MSRNFDIALGKRPVFYRICHGRCSF